jgi:hypothetical protein
LEEDVELLTVFEFLLAVPIKGFNLAERRWCERVESLLPDTFDVVNRVLLQYLVANDFNINFDWLAWVREFQRVGQEVEHDLKISV